MNRELKQRRRLRQRHLTSEFARLKLNRVYSISFSSSSFGIFFLELNPKELYQSSRKENESCVLCSRPRQNVK